MDMDTDTAMTDDGLFWNVCRELGLVCPLRKYRGPPKEATCDTCGRVSVYVFKARCSKPSCKRDLCVYCHSHPNLRRSQNLPIHNDSIQVICGYCDGTCDPENKDDNTSEDLNDSDLDGEDGTNDGVVFDDRYEEGSTRGDDSGLDEEDVALDSALNAVWDNFEPEVVRQNLVYTCLVNTVLNLADVAARLKGTKYNPRKFAAVIIRTRDCPRQQIRATSDPGNARAHARQYGPSACLRCSAVEHVRYHMADQATAGRPVFVKSEKIAVLIFSPGKIVCTGAKTPEQARVIIKETVEKLRAAGYHGARIRRLYVENMVASITLPGQINQARLAECHSSYCNYDPEQFPGAIVRYPEIHPMTILVFRSGKLVVTGARNSEDAKVSFMKIYPILRKFAIDTRTVVAPRYMADPFVKQATSTPTVAAAPALVSGRAAAAVAPTMQETPAAAAKVNKYIHKLVVRMAQPKGV